MKILKYPLLLLTISSLLLSCRENDSKFSKNEKNTDELVVSDIKYARSFSIANHHDYKVLQVNRPWPGKSESFNYLVVSKENLAKMTFQKDAYDAIITTPIKSLVATSTTHIPALENLNALEKLVGFPDTQYISSMPARELIAQGKIRELGSNENLNTEMVLELHPDVIIGFGINHQNNPYEVLEKADIPIIYNGDWTEETPLGKAEWIKFFGVLLNKEKEADSIFREIETAYRTIKDLASNTTTKPTVISGALYKDVWYLPAGESWAAQFINDANANYLYKNTNGTGSLSLSMETVLEKSQQADYWVAPSQFVSYTEMEQANGHYIQFKSFRERKVYTFAAAKGASGGLLYYELAPQRPDLVLKDLVHIFHPEVIPNHTPFFFTPLQ